MGCSPTAVSFASQLQPIFNASCVTGCHGGTRPAGNLSLVSGTAFRALVSVRSGCSDGRLLVSPGAPDASYLVNKLEGTNLCSGGQMPLRGAGLSVSQIALFRDWICQGAPNQLTAGVRGGSAVFQHDTTMTRLRPACPVQTGRPWCLCRMLCRFCTP